MNEPSAVARRLILLVDDDPGTIQVLYRTLSSYGDVRFSTSAAEGLQMARDLQPDLLLLDLEMPGISGLEVCRQLKADPRTADIVVMFVTSHHETDLEVQAFEMGAVDFIAKPVRPVVVQARVGTQLRLKALADALRQAALKDGLTGLANRAAFEAQLAWEWRRALRAAVPLSLLMVDVDHFKRFNDKYGHLGGDAALQQVAAQLQRATQRGGDLAARFGGEEFVVLLADTGGQAAQQLAERLCAAIAAVAIDVESSSEPARVTLSIGVATFDARSVEPSFGAAPKPATLVAAADRALYAAKAAGRNQVVFEPLDASNPARLATARAAPTG